MELRQLKYFAKVAEVKSFTEAARYLFVSQSTLSQQIKQLEQEIGENLFVRNSHRVELTDAGRAFLPPVLRTLNDFTFSIDTVRRLKDTKSGVLRLGATYTLSLNMTNAIRNFMRRFPNVKVEVYNERMDDLMLMLDRFQIDIAFTYSLIQFYQNVTTINLFESRLKAVMSQNHPMARKEKIWMDDLYHCRMATPVPGSSEYKALENILGDRFERLNVELEIANISLLLNLIASTNLVTIIPVDFTTSSNGLVALPIEDVTTTLKGCCHTRSSNDLSVVAGDFIRMLKEEDHFIV